MNIRSIITELDNMPRDDRDVIMRRALAIWAGMVDQVEREPGRVHSDALLNVFAMELKHHIDFQKRLSERENEY